MSRLVIVLALLFVAFLFGAERSDREEKSNLELMYKVFTYKSDSKNAFRVAQKGVEEFPDNPEWHKRLAQAAQVDNNMQLAIKEYIVLYGYEPGSLLRDKIIDLGTRYYQYDAISPLVKEKMEEKPTKKNIDSFVYIWENAGKPEEAADILYELYEKNSDEIYALEQALHLYIELGETDNVRKLIKRVYSDNIHSKKLSEEIAYYYYNMHDIQKAYSALLKIYPEKNDTEEYLRKISDLGWYVGDKERAVQASLELEKIGKAKRKDYDRIIGYEDKYLLDSMNAALKVWYIYKEKSYFYAFAYKAIDLKKYKELSKQLDRLKKNEADYAKFSSDPAFLMIEAEAYMHTGRRDAALYAMKRAGELKPDDPAITAALLWFYMDNQETKKLKSLLFELGKKDIDYSLYYPVASAYFDIQKTDKSMEYLSELLKKEPENVDYKYLYIYILQVQNEPQAVMKQVREIYTILDKKRKRNPALMKEDEFLDRYLRSAMMLINPDKFEKLLAKSKPYMTHLHFVNISILWALKNHAREKVEIDTKKLEKPESWILLSQALYFDDRDAMHRLLHKYFAELPIRDRVEALVRTGNVSSAVYLAFDALKYNRRDEQLYRQFKDLAEKRSDTLTLDTGYADRASLVQGYTTLSGRAYIAKGLWIDGKIYRSDNLSYDDKSLAYVPSSEKYFRIKLKKEFEKGYLSIGVGYSYVMRDFASARIDVMCRPESRVEMGVKAGYHEEAQDTLYLQLGGYRDYASLFTSFALLPSTQLSMEYEYDRYFGQDGLFLGKGSKYRFSVYRNIRIGYPDMSIGLFAELGRFNQGANRSEVMETLNPYPDTTLESLPDNYNNYGATFSYGMKNATGYTRVWRPYFEISPFYNSRLRETSISFRVGIGGEIFNQDHLVFGVDYDQSVNGTNEKYFNVFFKYKIFAF